MIQKWKIKREVERLKVQLQAVPLAVYEPYIQRQHDSARETMLHLTSGSLPARSDIALFLIYQPNGIKPSIQSTCRALWASGFSPLVVSNTPLSERDRKKLCECSYLVVERPNFGYDFGGYRDGNWVLQKLGLSPDNLLYLNDSVWFPVTLHQTLLEKMKATPHDYVGTQVFGDVAESGRKRGFFGSYCFMVKSPLLEKSAYQTFWNDYRVSSNKEVTLRRGERQFSHKMIDAADNAKGIYSINRFHRLVEKLDHKGLWEAIGDMVVTNPTLEAKQKSILSGGIDIAKSEEMRALIVASSESKNYIGAAPVLSLRELGFPMIKKNNERHYVIARKRILTAIDEERLPGLDPEIVNEIRQSVSVGRAR